MGVPKFYRWLSERYPCLSQVIKEHQIPEFDNLYLDMNGIIHPCSHPNDNDVHFRITDATIFKNIFNYIEVLFRIIKPKKNFFMAVDGCAPRAKMNQQRSRRFRTAKDAEDNIRKALMNGQTLPSTDRFDSNCITPGTEFMARLQDQLMYFVNKKISTDPLWQNCNIYLSGHSVPGEGEHKIMDFIRYCKSQPGYDENTRHCLYGLDADLIILGMVTHEPHFSLLREEVRYGKDQKQMVRPEEQTFHLLHLTLLREYLDFEFQTLKPNLHFPYNLERIIDDWAILGFLVGNDFVPHLPNLHIKNEALPYLFGIYKDYLVTADGYINDGGYLNVHRLKKFFEVLSKFDRDHFQDIYADLKWLESKGCGKILHKDKEEPRTPNKRFSELLKLTNQAEDSPMRTVNPFNNVSGLEDLYNTCDTPPTEKISAEVERLRVVDVEDDDGVEVEDEETFELEFKQHKRHYYMEKFDMDIVDDEQISRICFEYVRALQWISHYYFNGLQSWSWYYPYHYSPCISDVAALKAREIEFDMAEPFHPFEQLLAVLPAASRILLPDAFKNLMVDENSPIIDFYPPDFRTDLNGKQQDWEAVVLIPFINETRLMNAMSTCYPRLTDEEKGRNQFGDAFKYTYNKSLNFNYPSPCVGDEFEDVNVCRAEVERIHRNLHHLEPIHIKKGWLKGSMSDVYYHGFPTMKHREVKAFLKKANVKVFQQNSRQDNMIVKIISPPNQNMETLAKQLVGETVFVEWPYMVEAMVTSICNDTVRYYLDVKEENALVSKLVKGNEYENIKSEMRRVGNELMSRRGVELGAVEVLVETKLLLGQRYICEPDGSVHLEKEWKTSPNVYPFQTVVQNLQVHTHDAEVYDSIGKLYPPASIVFMLSSAHYGCSGEVIETLKTDGNVRVRVMLKVIPEPDFTKIIENYGSLSVHYIPDRTVAQRLGISTSLLGRITGNVFVTSDGGGGSGKSENIGLKLKYSGQNKEVLGFARRTDHGWTYSPLTIDILSDYMKKFPVVFEQLGRLSYQDQYNLSTLVPGKGPLYLDEVLAFLRTQKSHNVQPVRCGSNILDHPIVDEIGKAVENTKSMVGEKKVVKVKAKPHLLYRPTEQSGTIYADPGTEFLLFDRVVNIQYGIAVPIGLRGTIIGFHDVLTDENDKESPTDLRYEILFDDPFLGDKGAKLKRGYFMAGHSLLNISYGLRMEEKKGKAQPSTSSSVFQNQISHAPVAVGGSPYGAKSPATPKYNQNQTTPRSSYTNNNSSRYSGQQGSNNQSSTPSHGNQQRGRDSSSGNRHQNKNQEDLVSPDYWLKGSYNNNRSQYTPPQQQQQQQQHQQQQQQQQLRRTLLQHTPPGNQQHGGGGSQQHSGGGSQQHSGGGSQQHSGGGSQQHSGGGSQQHSGGGSQQHSGGGSRQNRYKQGNDDNDFINMWSAMQQTQNKPTPLKTSSTASPQGGPIDMDATVKLQQMLKINYQSPSPSGTTNTPPSASRQQHSAPPPPQQQQHRAPGLLSTPQQQQQQQGRRVPPGGAEPYSLLGMTQSTPSVAQSPNFFPYGSVPSQQFPYPLMQQPGMSPVADSTPMNFRMNSPQQQQHQGQHISSYQFPSPMMQTRALYQTPQSFYSPQQGYQMAPQFATNNPSGGNVRQSSSHTERRHQSHGQRKSSDDRQKSNMFIPHQVLMKNTNVRQSDADREIKEIIGIKDDGDNVMREEKPPQSDDEKLKSLIGILSTTATEESGGEGRTQGGSAQYKPKPLQHIPSSVRPSSAPTVGSLPTSTLLPTPPPPPPTTPTPLASNQPMEEAPAQQKKPQILLAPSFFGPKKKSM